MPKPMAVYHSDAWYDGLLTASSDWAANAPDPRAVLEHEVCPRCQELMDNYHGPWYCPACGLRSHSCAICMDSDGPVYPAAAGDYKCVYHRAGKPLPNSQ